MEKIENGVLTPDESSERDEITVLDQLFTLIHARHIAQSQRNAINDQFAST